MSRSYDFGVWDPVPYPADFWKEREDAIQASGITAVDAAVLLGLYIVSLPLDKFVPWLNSMVQIHESPRVDQASEIVGSVQRLMATSAVHLVNEEVAATLADEMASERVEPYGVQCMEVGAVDLTRFGSRLLESTGIVAIEGDARHTVVRSNLTSETCDIVGATMDSVDDFIRNVACFSPDESIVSVGPLTHVGRWCDRPWRIHASGWKRSVKLSFDET